MELQLEDKHVLITGGYGGIGLACAKEFANEGSVLSLAGREPTELEAAKRALEQNGARVRTFVVDLTDAGDVLRAIHQAEMTNGPVDVLVNAAGAAKQKPFAELSPEDWREGIDAKFLTSINMIDPMVKRMSSRGTGAIVNIIGMGGKLPISTHLTGGAANAALMLATAGLAMAYAPHGVRINGINPTKTATTRIAQSLNAQAKQERISVEEALRLATKEASMGRLASPEEIAAVVVFLASPRAEYISGAIVSVDGATRPVIV